MGRQYAVVAMAMVPRRRHERGEALEHFERGSSEEPLHRYRALGGCGRDGRHRTDWSSLQSRIRFWSDVPLTFDQSLARVGKSLAPNPTMPPPRPKLAAAHAREPEGGDTGTTAAMQVAADLRRRIVQGEFKPGARLKIDEIAELCAVSHMPVRVALQSLEAEGVLDIYPHRGAVIKAVDARFVSNMLEVRGAMEVMLSVRCAQLVDRAGLEEIEGLVAEYEDAAQRNRPLAIVSANLRLHDAINRWADNPEALRVLGRGRLLIQALRARYGFGGGRVEEAVREHRLLFRAIARRDERRAGEIARLHCEHARDELLSLLAR